MIYIQLNLDNTYKQKLPATNFLFDDTHYCPAENLSADEMAQFKVVPLTETTKPVFNELTHTCVEGPAELGLDGNWHQTWNVVALNTAIAQSNVAAAVVKATQNRLDFFARTRNYDGILSACTYATSTIPKFAAEGQYCVGIRDTTWNTLYTILAEVQAGTRTMPLNFAEVEPLLPVLTWPA